MELGSNNTLLLNVDDNDIGNDGCFSIPAGIISIASRCFSNCRKLKCIKMPDSVSQVSILAFDNCINLETAYLPRAVQVIQSLTFKGCIKLHTLFIFNSKVMISHQAVDRGVKPRYIVIYGDEQQVAVVKSRAAPCLQPSIISKSMNQQIEQCVQSNLKLLLDVPQTHSGFRYIQKAHVLPIDIFHHLKLFSANSDNRYYRKAQYLISKLLLPNDVSQLERFKQTVNSIVNDCINVAIELNSTPKQKHATRCNIL